jgi:hypothetical protein
MKEITMEQSRRLVHLEAVIYKHKASFLTAAAALMEIRDSGLYLVEHETFEEYCQEKWGFSRSYACRLIAADSIRKSLEINKTSVPIGTLTHEGQLRPLTKLPPERRGAAWAEAVETSKNGHPTAREVEAVVEKMQPKPSPKPTPATEQPDAEELQTFLDGATEENERLKSTIASLSNSDAAGEILAWKGKFESACGRVTQLQATEKELMKQCKFYQHICDDLRKLLELEKASQIVPKVKELLK